MKSFYGAMGVLLTLGLGLAFLALWGFASLTEEMMEGEILRMDRAALQWLNGHATPFLDRVALEVTAVGNLTVMGVLAVVVVALLWAVRERTYAALVGVSVGGAALLIHGLKMLFDRPRPQVVEWRAHYEVSSAAYPSGHAMISMVTFLVLAYVFHRLADRRVASLVGGVVVALSIGMVGLSRLYLGVHYPSDVAAGYAVGFAWAVFCALAAEGWGRIGGKGSEG